MSGPGLILSTLQRCGWHRLGWLLPRKTWREMKRITGKVHNRRLTSEVVSTKDLIMTMEVQFSASEGWYEPERRICCRSRMQQICIPVGRRIHLLMEFTRSIADRIMRKPNKHVFVATTESVHVFFAMFANPDEAAEVVGLDICSKANPNNGLQMSGRGCR